MAAFVIGLGVRTGYSIGRIYGRLLVSPWQDVLASVAGRTPSTGYRWPSDADEIMLSFTRDEVAVILLEPRTHLTDEQIALAESVMGKFVDAYGRRRR